MVNEYQGYLMYACRQKALEDALLHSGQFKEALQAVLDWLYKVEPQLGEDQLVHGDTDTVRSLRDEHKVIIITAAICLCCLFTIPLVRHSA